MILLYNFKITLLPFVFVCVFVFFLFFSEGRLSIGCFSASMERASVSTNPRTVEEVFKDYKGRRAGMLKALTAGEN